MQTLITELDRLRLNTCIDWLPIHLLRTTGVGDLVDRIKTATSVPASEIPAALVTMNSIVRIRYLQDGEELVLRLVYPSSRIPEDPNVRAVSVISPVGAALLGAREGEVVRWMAPAGEKAGEVLRVIYQPEASGDPD